MPCRPGRSATCLKNVSGDELAEAIRQAYAGRPTLAPEAAPGADSNHAEPRATLGKDLTRRELEVLALLVKGHEQPRDRRAPGVSRATVKVHVSSILSKLGVSNRAEAISLAIQHKLVR